MPQAVEHLQKQPEGKALVVLANAPGGQLVIGGVEDSRQVLRVADPLNDKRDVFSLLEQGLVTLTISDKPHRRLRRSRVTQKGRRLPEQTEDEHST